MRIEHDKKINAKYIYLKKGVIVSTKKESDNVLCDYDKNGQLIGIEILA